MTAGADNAKPDWAIVMLPAPPQDAPDANLREQLGEFRALLVISLLMTESVGEDQILELAASSAPGLGPWRIVGYGFTDGSWRPALDCGVPVPSDLAGGLPRWAAARPGRAARPRLGVGLPAAQRQRAAWPHGRVLRAGAVRRGTIPYPGHRTADRCRRVERPAARQANAAPRQNSPPPIPRSPRR